jgi:arylsulfatase A-like enzyme
VQQGKQTDTLVSLEDLAATFVDCAKSKPMAGMDAKSLRPLLEGSASTHRDAVAGGLNDWHYAVDGRFTLVREGDEAARLYDREAGPWEDEDVAAAHPDVVERLGALLPRGSESK